MKKVIHDVVKKISENIDNMNKDNVNRNIQYLFQNYISDNNKYITCDSNKENEEDFNDEYSIQIDTHSMDAFIPKERIDQVSFLNNEAYMKILNSKIKVKNGFDYNKFLYANNFNRNFYGFYTIIIITITISSKIFQIFMALQHL